MIQENTSRNLLVYDLWEKGRTIDEISLDLGIPRSTVGYYVRKYNRYAKRGEPIAFEGLRKKPDEKVMAAMGYIKTNFFNVMTQTLLEKDGIDKVYKMLMVLKLAKELWRDIFPTPEEAQAFFNNFIYMMKQIISVYSQTGSTPAS